MDFEELLAFCIATDKLDGIKALGLTKDIVNDVFLCNPTIPAASDGIQPPKILRPTPLVYAILCRNLPIVKYLADQDADLSWASPSNGWRPIHYAAAVRSRDICEFLISRVPDSYNALTDHGATPLHIAVTWGDGPTIAALLNSGADVNFANINGHTPLHMSVVHPYPEIARLLLRFGANVNTKNQANETALDIAQRQGNTKVAELLADAQVNPKKYGPPSNFPSTLSDQQLWREIQSIECFWLEHFPRRPLPIKTDTEFN
jgi:ankyrin repeat protein